MPSTFFGGGDMHWFVIILFGFLFVGLINPGVFKLKSRWLVFLIFLVLYFVGMSVGRDGKRTEPSKDVVNSAQKTDNKITEIDSKPLNQWVYEESKDEMRGTVTKFAILKSDTTVDFPFPYKGGSYLNIQVRKSAKFGEDVMFVVNKGHLICDYNNCSVNVKFDDGKVTSYPASRAAGGDSTTLFLDGGVSSFVDKLKKSKSIMVEVDFFKHGSEQFSFTNNGLIWN